MDSLQPLMFLEGAWHGQGQGPYGEYEFEVQVERRGRWLLMTNSIFEPQTDAIAYVSTQVYGYDDDGLVLHFFDTAGAFEFHGGQSGERIELNWRDGNDLRRSEYWPADGGKVRFRYQAMLPDESPEVSMFEGIWQRGERPRSQLR